MAEELAVVTGASTGIGYHLARIAVENGYALVICADEDKVHEAADKLRRLGGEVDGRRPGGVQEFWQAIGGDSSSPMPAEPSARRSTRRRGRTSSCASTSTFSKRRRCCIGWRERCPEGARAGSW